MYVNGYLLPIPEAEKSAYVAFCQVFAEVVKDHGALEIFENWESDVPDGKLTDFRRAVAAEPGERIVFSWVVWPDRGTADEAHANMWEDPRMTAFDHVPGDGKRMVIGGFEPIVAYRSAQSIDHAS